MTSLPKGSGRPKPWKPGDTGLYNDRVSQSRKVLRLFNDRRKPPALRGKVYGLWHGGGSYSTPDPSNPEHIEEFRSLRQAREVFSARYAGRDPIKGLRTPAVDETSEMQVFKGHPGEMRDPYPDRIIKRGKRGGIRTERT